MKNRTLQFFAGICSLLLVSGCGAMPHHAETRTELVPQLIFQGGPEGAIVNIDGAEVGRINGDKTKIAIGDGTHSVTVQWQGQTVFQKTIFIEDGTQKIIPLSK